MLGNYSNKRAGRPPGTRLSMSKVVGRVATVLSPRSRSRQNHTSSMFGIDEASEGPIVAFSGISPSESIQKVCSIMQFKQSLLNSLIFSLDDISPFLKFIMDSGGDFICSSDGIKKLTSITHLVVNSHDLRTRRVKFLAALCRIPENIVSYDWIVKSQQSNTFLPLDGFRINASVSAENDNDFSLQRSINNAIVNLQNGGILGGRCVYAGPGVAGNLGPSRDEIDALVRSAGGVCFSNISGVNKMIKNRVDCRKLIVISKSGRTLPGGAITAIAKGALDMAWADFITALLYQSFPSNIAQQQSIIDDNRVIDLTRQNEGSEFNGRFVKLLSLKLGISPRRSISNAGIADPNRAFLGSNGNFAVYVSVGSPSSVAIRYYNSEGVLKFEALAPPPEDCFKAIQGNAGQDICIFWDACNAAFASGGTTIQGATSALNAVAHRRHFFWFDCIDDLKIVLFYMLGQDRKLVDEFFDETGRFFAAEPSQPDHSVVKPMDAMEEDELPVRLGYFGDGHYEYDPRSHSQLF